MRALNGRFSTPEEVVKQKLMSYFIMLLFIGFTWGMSVSPRVYQVFAREGANNAKLDEQPLKTTTPSPTPSPTPVIVPAKTQKELIIDEIIEVFGKDAAEAIAIVRTCENKAFDPKAVNHNKNGTWDAGIFMVNQVHGYSLEDMQDYHKNIKAAYKIFKHSGWSAWACSEQIGVRPFWK